MGGGVLGKIVIKKCELFFIIENMYVLFGVGYFLILVKYKLLLVLDYFMIIMIVFLNKLYVNMWLEGF